MSRYSLSTEMVPAPCFRQCDGPMAAITGPHDASRNREAHGRGRRTTIAAEQITAGSAFDGSATSSPPFTARTVTWP